MSDIMALYAEGASSLCVNGSVDMLGRLAGISASKYTGYPPYDDAPKEGEFDWEGFTRNLAIGLGVVAVCAIGAAISIATLGATTYFCLTGRRPPDILQRLQEGQQRIVFTAKERMKIPKKWRNIILQCLELDYHKRPQSVEELAQI